MNCLRMMKAMQLLVPLVTIILVVHGTNTDTANHNATSVRPFNVVESVVTQHLDNFDPTNDATWQQRFVMDGQYWRSGGCLFILLSGFWEATTDFLDGSAVHAMAQEFGCYLFHLEHRYYGESRPTEDLSLENLRFLNVEQALADIAHFIEYIKYQRVIEGAEDSPVIVLGRHYAGSLAVWFRQSYPHLAIGGWSSSSPTMAQFDYHQFKELSGAVYRFYGGNDCYGRLERGFAAMEQMVTDGQSEELSELFNLCDELGSLQDIRLFFAIMAEIFSLYPQYGQIQDIESVCNIITNDTLSDAEGIASFVVDSLYGGNQCIPIDYEQTVEDDRETSWDSYNSQIGARQATYQSCSQLGWYHSSSSRFQPFGSSFPVEFIFEACRDVFGDLFTPELMLANAARFNSAFAGITPAATNVIYAHGEMDPWRTIGVQSNANNPLATVVIIEGVSRSYDVTPISDDDSDAVREAKAHIMDTIRGWIIASQTQ